MNVLTSSGIRNHGCMFPIFFIGFGYFKATIKLKIALLYVKIENLLVLVVVHPPTPVHRTLFSGKYLVFCYDFNWTASRDYLM